ncbi:WD40 repeat-like protein [Marasmius fiardii PR-910]|nr:WD40 repeat-like protein [Marasmius fiardii PR-910]
MHITSDEINRLIYSYFKDSGFEHSAYALAKESHLENSPCFAKHVPRGELVELLSKSLLYTEVECHFRGGELAANCKTAFSLLEPHLCSTEPAVQPPPPVGAVVDYYPGAPVMYSTPLAPESDEKTKTDVIVPESSTKRKASLPPSSDNPAEKRPRTDPSDATTVATPEDQSKVNTTLPDSQPQPSSAIPSTPSEIKKIMSKPPPRQQGPADSQTNREAIRLLGGHIAEVFVCAWNPARRNLLASGSKDAVMKIWNMPDPPNPFSFAPLPADPVTTKFTTAEASDITCLSWNPQGTLLAISAYDCLLRICDISGNVIYKSNDHKGPIFTARFSPSGRWLVTASLDHTSCVWDVHNLRLHRMFGAHEDCCLDVDWISDSMFASCSADKVVHLLSVDHPNPVKSFRGHKDEINQLKANPSGTRLASCSDDMTTRIWNVSNISTTPPDDSIPGLGGFGSDSNPVVLNGHKHSVSTIEWFRHPQVKNELIATGAFDATVRIWDSVTGQCERVLSDHKRPIYALSVSPNGAWLASGGGDGWLHIYTIKDFSKIWSWYAGPEKPGVFEIDWQAYDNGNGGEVDRIAMALECWKVGVIDIRRIPAVWDTRSWI